MTNKGFQPEQAILIVILSGAKDLAVGFQEANACRPEGALLLVIPNERSEGWISFLVLSTVKVEIPRPKNRPRDDKITRNSNPSYFPP